MNNEMKPTRVQFQIGKSAPISLQQWVKNQSLPINKAVREVLNHFVYIYGTEDILSDEVRQKMSMQYNNVNDSVSPASQVVQAEMTQEKFDKEVVDSTINQSIQTDDEQHEQIETKTTRKIKKRDIDI